MLELVRAGLQINEEVKRLSAQVKEDIEDAAAEAEALKVAKAHAQAEKAAASASAASSPNGEVASKSEGAGA